MFDSAFVSNKTTLNVLIYNVRIRLCIHFRYSHCAIINYKTFLGRCAMKRPKIIVIGSLNMDLVVTMERMPQMGETIQGQNIHYISGGKGANQAVGCAKLGADITMIGAVGADLFGQQIRKQLIEYKVTTDKIAQVDSLPTGTATILHTTNDNSIIIVSGANSAC